MLDEAENVLVNFFIYFLKKIIFFGQLGFKSNWHKVQLNTNLFSDTQKYLYTEEWLD